MTHLTLVHPAPKLHLRVISGVTTFRCDRLRLWLQPSSCAQRHEVAELSATHSLHRIGSNNDAVPVDAKECRGCHVGAQHLREHPTNVVRRGMRKRRNPYTRSPAREFQIGERIGIFALVGIFDRSGRAKAASVWVKCTRCGTDHALTWTSRTRPSKRRFCRTCQPPPPKPPGYGRMDLKP